MEHTEILRELNACVTLCNYCYSACLNEKEVSLFARCIELDRECAEICQLTASIVLRDSENANHFLSLCAIICEACAEECEKHDSEHCKKCAHVCRSCAAMCMQEHSSH
jgi:hypothetical protein